MKFLPRINHLFFIFIFFAAFFLSCTVKSFAANPQDVFYGNLNSLNYEEDVSFQKAQETGKAQIYVGPVKNREVLETLKAFADQIVCTNPKRCSPQQTALGNIGLAMGTLYTVPPASGLAYTKDVLAHAGLAQPVLAQGIGFAGLSPFLPLWKTFRNISYTILIIVMISIGFMVIFRMKIDPKTVVSVQAALPKIVLALLLITLSYPIVGFMVDLMYLVMAIVISLLASGFPHADPTLITNLQSSYMNASGIDLMGKVWDPGVNTILSPLGAITGIATGATTIAVIIGAFTAFTFSAVWIPATLAALSPALILVVVLALGLLFTYIRILFLLMNSYIQLLIGLILGPLILLQEAIPGRSAFTEWLLNIMANLVVFPAVAGVFLFSEIISSPNADFSAIWQPPFLGWNGVGIFNAFLSMGILFAAPTIVAQVKKIFHPKPILPISAGSAFSPVTGAAQTGMGAASQWYYMQQLIGHDGEGPIGKIMKGLGLGGGGGHKT